MIVKNLKELDSFMPCLLSSPKGDEVFYAVAGNGDLDNAVFEYLVGDEASLGFSIPAITFDFLLGTRNNYLSLDKFVGKNEIYHKLAVLSKKRGSYCFEFPLIQGKRHYLYACSVYSWPEKSAFVVCLRRLRFLERYLGEYSEKNRRDYTTALLNKESCLNAIRPNDHLMVVFTDLNNFKLINDIYGHIMGDKILRAFADCLMENKPEEAHAYRFGGDEFIVVLPSYDKAKTSEWLNKTEEAFLSGGNLGLPVSFSAGCCPMSPSIKSPLYLIRCSDKAMYLAKKKEVPFYILDEEEALKIIQDDQTNGN